VRRPGARHAWLSITPEPEQELPRALATLHAGGPPAPQLVERELARAERLVTRGRRRAWRAYLAEALALARTGEDPAVAEAGDPAVAEAGDPAVAEARAVVEDVIHNHDQLELGL
jgi:hypothetical protein